MSKVFETNVLKGKSLASGMKKRLPELSKYGVKEADLPDQWEGFGLMDKR